MPEMSEENYNALMERLKQQDEKIATLEKKFHDVSAMNSVLLRTTGDGSQVQTKPERMKELEKKLKGGLNHA